MPQLNAWVGSGSSYNPWLNLERHAHRAVNAAVRRGQEHFRRENKRNADSNVYDFESYINRPSKRARTSAPTGNEMVVRRRPYTRKRAVAKPYRRAFKKRGRYPRPERGIRWARTVELKMVMPISLSGAAGALDGFTCKANSLSDPSGAEGGWLPRYLDQWAGLYTKYKVMGSTITITGHTSDATGAAVTGISLRRDASLETGWFEYSEQKDPCVKKITSSDIDLFTLRLKYTPKKFWHLTRMKDADNQGAALSTTPSDPTDICYFHIYTQDFNSTNNCSAELHCEVKYLVYLYNPVEVAYSAV